MIKIKNISQAYGKKQVLFDRIKEIVVEKDLLVIN